MPSFKSTQFDDTFETSIPKMMEDGRPFWKVVSKVITASEKLVTRQSKFPNQRDDVMNHILAAWEKCDFNTKSKYDLYERAFLGDMENLDVFLCTIKLLTPQDVEQFIKSSSLKDQWAGFINVALEDSENLVLDLIAARPHLQLLVEQTLRAGYQMSDNVRPAQVVRFFDIIPSSSSVMVENFKKHCAEHHTYTRQLLDDGNHRAVRRSLKELDRSSSMFIGVATPQDWISWYDILVANDKEMEEVVTEDMSYLPAFAQKSVLSELVPLKKERKRKGSKI